MLQATLKHMLFSGKVLQDSARITSVVPRNTSKFILLVHHNFPWNFGALKFTDTKSVLALGVQGVGSVQ